MRSFFKLSILMAMLLVTASLFGQGTTGSLAGTVTQDGNPLPGVTVTATSPNLQGERQAVTNEAGGYAIGNLPPGPYTVRFELSGLQTVTRQQHVGVAQNPRLDADLKVAAVSEAITVTATAAAVAETKEVQANYDHELIDELPMARTVVAITNLSPGVVTGVNGPQISGGFSFDNLYTVNGAVVNENVRGQPHNLFVEDAIQETTVQVAGISAEFGNFTGGVVNAITKSGGNEFSGSFRDTFLNPSWTAQSPDVWAFKTTPVAANAPDDQKVELIRQKKNTGKNNQTFEATLGGRIIRDRLWFFGAGRDAQIDADRTFSDGTGQNRYKFDSKERRLEGKLTGSITSRHSIVGSILDAPIENQNECQLGCYDAQGLIGASGRESSFQAVNYNGVITNNFLIEGRWSKKDFTFVDTGGTDHDRVTGTPIRLALVTGAPTTNESYFCGNCTPEERDNQTWAAKMTYYLGTRSLGTHNVTAGYDHWHETRLANNFQSATNFSFQAGGFAPKKVNGQTLVSISGGGTDLMINWPILVESQGSDLNTDSLWFNDRWDINNRWSLNLGARYDRNDSANSVGATVADDSLISPRVGVTLDTFGNGRLRFNASYGVYAGRLAETISSLNSPAGNPAIYVNVYAGPNIIDVTPEEAMRRIWQWYDEQGGFDKVPFIQTTVPGVQTQIRESLVSPNVEEMAFGVATQIGSAFLRADYVNREWQDFYTSERSLGIGRVTLPSGAPADLTLVVNSDNLTREYEGITLQGAYRLFNRITLGGNYTWSEIIGNITGETTGSGVVTETADNFQPEYFGFAQNNPVGFLSTDQTHKLRAWAGVDFPTFLGNFNISLLQAFDTGSPYSHAATIDIRSSANFYCPQPLGGTQTACGKAGGVTNPGYVTPPATVTYFFSDRGEFRFDDVSSTSLALNYDTNPAWLRGASLFLQGEVLNVFNNDAGSWNTTILTHRDPGCWQTADPTLRCARFNPMAGDVPVEGVHYRKDARYGKPTNVSTPVIGVDGLSFPTTAHFQNPRTYRGSIGLRF